MKLVLRYFLFLCFLMNPIFSHAEILVGVAQRSITPPDGTPLAGYAARQEVGRRGDEKDPLLAISLFIDNQQKKVVFCSVDHLGFPYRIVQEITKRVHQEPQLKDCEIYIGSSHTHSGGGAYLNIGGIGEKLAGPYNEDVVQFYIQETVQAILDSTARPIPGKIGIGCGKAEGLSSYRGAWPEGIQPVPDVAIIKVTDIHDKPFAVLFNYAVHPTILDKDNYFFSADFVGNTRDHIQKFLGESIQPIYFNGAQGDILPVIFNRSDRFQSCDILGQKLAETVVQIWEETDTENNLEIQTQKYTYTFAPQTTPHGITFPLKEYTSELNCMVLNSLDKLHAILMIPGELSCIFDRQLKNLASQLGYNHISCFGLTADAHGYFILPESYDHKTMESYLSIGGREYGEWMRIQLQQLLETTRGL